MRFNFNFCGDLMTLEIRKKLYKTVQSTPFISLYHEQTHFSHHSDILNGHFWNSLHCNEISRKCKDGTTFNVVECALVYYDTQTYFQSFTHLGISIRDDGRADKDVLRRISIAKRNI